MPKRISLPGIQCPPSPFPKRNASGPFSWCPYPTPGWTARGAKGNYSSSLPLQRGCDTLCPSGPILMPAIIWLRVESLNFFPEDFPYTYSMPKLASMEVLLWERITEYIGLWSFSKFPFFNLVAFQYINADFSLAVSQRYCSFFAF